MPEPLDPALLAAAAAAFDIQPQDLSPVRGGNFSHVYAFQRGGRECILRLTPPNAEIDTTALRAGMALSAHLAAAGVGTPAPLPAAGGGLIEPLASPRGTYLAAAFERAPGTLAEELDFALWDQARFAHLGQAVGRFHAASRSYQPAPGMERPDWDQTGSCFNPPEEIADEALRLRRAEAWRAVQALPRDPAAWGWIHADLHGGNFMLDPLSGRITLLDFDDCARGWYVMDIAMLLHDFLVLCPWEDKTAFAAHLLRAFLPAYLAAMPLDGEWIERLPLFLKLVETGIYAQVAEFADSMEPDSWVGRFMHGRRQRIAGAVPVVDLDFGRVYRECRP